MEKRVLVIGFRGDEPTQDQAVNAVVAMAKSGCAIDATENIDVHCFNSTELAMFAAAVADDKKKAGKSVTVKLQSSKHKFCDADKEKIINFFSELFNG